MAKMDWAYATTYWIEHPNRCNNVRKGRGIEVVSGLKIRTSLPIGAYAVLIMSGLKRVENRSMMPSPAKGRCAMSVSKKFCRAEYDSLVTWLGAKVVR